MFKKTAVLFVIIIVLLLSSCAPSPKLVILTDTPSPSPSVQASALPSVSPSGVYSELPGLTATEFPMDNTSVTPDDKGDTGDDDGDNSEMSPEQQRLWDIINDPRSEGYGDLPVLKPEISDADMAVFNPDKLSDYLISGLYDEIDGYLNIDKASLSDGKLYLTVDYDIYVDADDAYQYLKKTFSLTDKEILCLKNFSDSDCSIHKGEMYTYDSWGNINGTLSDEDEEGIADSDIDPDYIEAGDIDLPPMPVADDAIITLVDYDNMDAYQLTTSKFADYLLQGKSENENDQIGNNFWFTYSDGVITGIAEEYSE